MYRQLFLVVYVQCGLLGSLGSSDSCYFCTGTPQCGDPIDYNEVSPRDCIENSICLKYVSSSKNGREMVAHELTYRQCFHAELLDEDVCTLVKNNEEEQLRQLNHTLAEFQCYICDATNCNPAPHFRGSLLTWISIFVIPLNILTFI